MHRQFSSVAALVAVLFLSCWATPASAQRTLLIGSRGAEQTMDPAYRAALQAALVANGADVVPDEALHAIVDERLSREPVEVGADEVGELAAAVRELEALVATRQRETALRQAEHVRALSEGTVDALAEQRELARTLMSGCLADAWLHLQMNETDAARERLHACREMHPDVAVDTRTTPPVVARLLTEIDRELASRPRRTVQIDTTHEGCNVLLNGRHVGTTPEPIADVPIGRYQVELVCPRVAHRRVHTLVVADEDRWIAIDPGFDDALHTNGVIELVHPTAAGESASHVEYALRVATAASAGEAIVFSPHGAEVRADRVSLGGGVLASVLMNAPDDAVDAVAALAGGNSIDLTGSAPQPYRRWSAVTVAAGQTAAPPTPGRAPIPTDSGLQIAGITVGAIGLAALGGAWATYGIWTGYRDERAAITDPSLSRHYVLGQQIEQTEWAGVSLGVGGAVMIAASIPMWLPDDGIDDVSRVPWWSWAIGAAGVGAVGVGAAFAILHGQQVFAPDFQTCMCTIPRSTLFLASLFFETGAAALALPLTHLLRVAAGPSAPTIQASAGPSSASISVGGVW